MPRVILTRDMAIAGKHFPKGSTQDIPQESYNYLKGNGAVIDHRDDAVRVQAEAAPPVVTLASPPPPSHTPPLPTPPVPPVVTTADPAGAVEPSPVPPATEPPPKKVKGSRF